MSSSWRVGETRFLGLPGWSGWLAFGAIALLAVAGAVAVFLLAGSGLAATVAGLVLFGAFTWLGMVSDWWGFAFFLAGREVEAERRRRRGR